jgi:hypothetical protein
MDQFRVLLGLSPATHYTEAPANARAASAAPSWCDRLRLPASAGTGRQDGALDARIRIVV